MHDAFVPHCIQWVSLHLLDKANLHRLETRSSKKCNIVYINYYFGGHFDVVHDLKTPINVIFNN